MFNTVNSVLIALIFALVSVILYKIYDKYGVEGSKYGSILVAVGAVAYSVASFTDLSALGGQGLGVSLSGISGLDSLVFNSVNLISLGAYGEVASLIAKGSQKDLALIGLIATAFAVSVMAIRFTTIYGLIRISAGKRAGEVTRLSAVWLSVVLASVLTFVLSFTVLTSPVELRNNITNRVGGLLGAISKEPVDVSLHTSFLTNKVAAAVSKFQAIAPQSGAEVGGKVLGFDASFTLPINLFTVFILLLIGIYVIHFFRSVDSFFLGSSIILLALMGPMGLETSYVAFVLSLAIMAWLLSVVLRYRVKAGNIFVYSLIAVFIMALVVDNFSLPSYVAVPLLVLLVAIPIYLVAYAVSFFIAAVHSFWASSRRGGLMKRSKKDMEESYGPVWTKVMAGEITMLLLAGLFVYGGIYGVLWASIVVLGMSGVFGVSRFYEEAKESQKQLPKDGMENV